jgi:Cu+-exporting ATPase
VAKVKDPVCGMTIEDKDAVATSDYHGHRYHFCSQDCKTEFDANPDDYADRTAGG